MFMTRHDPLGTIFSHEAQAAINATLEKLENRKPMWAVIARDHVRDGYTQEETAERHGLTRDKVAKALPSVLGVLRTELESFKEYC